MGDVVPFKRPKLKDKFKGRSLCREGFHRWVVVKESQFDVKQGRLVTLLRCERCGQGKTEAR
ncbi:hypothetical protein [Simiduia agarivorans]|uniref:Uncharacterized protein n=1 Tax=Simiduia agarivorans (strain DSM 21679 / JCM 13881 / BCRC 17597 / SA1) TaxID=1117647 RepID=K4KWA1_SIMAS|nr:hypothetical protein [Simiduia agarivorans]AFU98177.1 hypothetical protein M5M_04850 [Simiduia agarivorans SA1 = DSM 21679]